MEKRLFSNNIFKKLVAVIATVAIMLAVAPFAGIFDLALNASAEMPVFDETLGKKTDNGDGTLTAEPYEGMGFRGWFLADGTEVSYEKTVTIADGKTASDYIPVFYDFNLINNGDFEEYADGTNLSTGNIAEEEKWNGITWEYISGAETGNWADSVKVTNAAAKTGTKSILLNSFHHCTYKELNNLEPNTLYTLTYYFNMVVTNIIPEKDQYLRRSYIVGEDVAENELLNGYSYPSDMEYLDVRIFDTTTGVCEENEWKEVKHTFFTGDNTSAKLLIYYVNEDVGGVRPPFYVDDVSLVKDNMLSPSEYFNDSFDTNSYANWTKLNNSLNLELVDNALQVTSNGGTQMLQSAPFFAKKGAEYDITFDYTSVNVADSNRFNISLSNTAGQYGAGGYYAISGESYANSEFEVTVEQDSRSGEANFYNYDDSNISRAFFGQEDFKGWLFGIGKITLSEGVKVTIHFKADKNTLVYLNTWLDSAGTYTIDNLAVSETNVPISSKLSSAVKVVGTAIRTEGTQGMRYKTQVDKKLLTVDNDYGIRLVEYGTLAIKADKVSGEITINTPGVKKGVAYSFADKIDKVFAKDNGSLYFTGVLINIAEENYNADYRVRAYFTYLDAEGNEVTFYADQNDIAVYPVSKAAYSARNAKGDLVESATVREYLYNNIISKYTDKKITINNINSIYDNFQGIRSTVYHGTVFFEDSHGRKYTDAQAAIEMNRLVDTKVDNVRTRFDSNWAWENGQWNWNSEKMQAFYKWAKMLSDRNISITLQAGWHLYDFICFYNKMYNTGITDTEQDPDGVGHSSIPEVNYLHGYTDDASAKATAIYGEDANAAAIEADARALGLNFTDAEFAHYSVAAARYGEWIKQGIEAIRANGGNVEFVLPFTESGDVRTGDATFSYDEWIIMTMGLQNALTDAGLRDSLKLVGPAQSVYANQERTSLLEYVYSKINGTAYANMIDINAMHQYTRPNWETGMANTVYDPNSSYSLADENFTYYNNVLTNAGLRAQEFWCDEYFAKAPDAMWWDNVGMQMTQFAAGLTAGINNGVNRFLTWQMFDTLWDADRTNTNGEFIGGVHAVGTCPSLIKADGDKCTTPDCPCKAYTYSSYTPRTTYYGINLIGRYMNNENASVFETTVANGVDANGGIFVSSIKNDAGKTVILVVNTNSVVSTVDIALESAVNNNFNRYTYDPNEVVPTAEAKSITSDKEISLDGTSFFDTIPAQSFAIYVEGGTTGDSDVNIPWFN